MQKLNKPPLTNSIAEQKGAGLIMFVLLLVLVGTGALLYFLGDSNIKKQREIKTFSSLSDAKAALIGYAVLQPSKPGTLPCTDSLNNGSGVTSGTNACAKYIGRLPWKQLGMPMLKDSYGECLWYALSPNFRNQMTTANRKLNPLNALTNGTINIVNDLDVPIVSDNPVIALIMAPNFPVGGQIRSGMVTTYCTGDSIASNYLDIKGLINNATGNVVGTSYTFKKGIPDINFNDQIVYITAKDLFPILRKRIVKEILGDVDVKSGLVKYYQSPAGAPHNNYPCPSATVAGNESCGLVTGFIPYNDPTVGLQYTSLGTWLIDNGWFSMTTYTYLNSTHIKVTVIDPLGSYTCDRNMNISSCASP